MISRVAESCFWLFRYLERIESISRLLAVSRSFVLDLELDAGAHWRPLIVVSGEQERFESLHGDAAADDPETVQEYLVWSEESPVSIVSSARWARENSRMIREVISPDMWEALNGFWHWLRRGPGRRAYRADRDRFYARATEISSLFLGLSHNTMLHEEAFEFMRLGMLLERAGQTARLVDVRHHAMGPSRDRPERAEDVAHWSALLQGCGATELFLKRASGVLSGAAITEFLLLDVRFPRSVRHCVDRARNFLRMIRPRRAPSIGKRSAVLLDDLARDLRDTEVEDVFGRGVHEVLTRLIERTDEVCASVHDDYFDPPLAGPAARRRRRSRGSRKARSKARS